MYCIEQRILNQLLSFELSIYIDKDKIEHVLLCQEVNNNILDGISDFHGSINFEAYVNHVHILNRSNLFSFLRLKGDCDIFGRLMYTMLTLKYPTRHFRVYVHLDIKDGMIIRFHEKRPGQPNWAEKTEEKFGIIFRIYE